MPSASIVMMPLCFHNNEYFNNGLDEVETLEDFPDLGFGAVTGKLIDNGKFKAPTLRNIVYTAPYMHDGRLKPWKRSWTFITKEFITQIIWTKIY